MAFQNSGWKLQNTDQDISRTYQDNSSSLFKFEVDNGGSGGLGFSSESKCFNSFLSSESGSSNGGGISSSWMNEKKMDVGILVEQELLKEARKRKGQF